MLNIVVTGVGGFIGGWVARCLAGRGHNICGLYRNHIADETRQTRGITLSQFDLAEEVRLPGQYDALIHCAADIPGLCDDPVKLVRSNVEGASCIFTAARNAGVYTVVNLSSMSVYGNISVPEVTEELQPDSQDVYGQSKIAAERLLDRQCAEGQFRSGLSIRLPGTVGRGSHHNYLSSVMERILSNEQVELHNPDALFNNIVYVGDLAGFMEQWILRSMVGYFVTNLAAEKPLPIGEVVEAIYDCAGRDPRITVKDGGKTPFLISLDQARSLGYAPATVLTSIKSFVNDCIA